MTIQAPTRITIEVHQPDPDSAAAAQVPTVHVYPESPSSAQPAMAAMPREDQPAPAAFDPGECRCLDAEDCNADHAND
ncbi:MAG TPA: hypothetical protein VHR16_08320 [Candidatus Limnocylindrales bacterium]|jgi:hypothetical protein|nr:hypothetical protein [Candidatus Limnocylindrales bacterium]